MLDRADKRDHLDFSVARYFAQGSRNDRFLNRELSWLQFNERVLSLAADADVPLLERVRFLAIFSSNLDEFFMKRVGSLKEQVRAGIAAFSLDNRTASEQLTAVRGEVIRLLEKRRYLLQEVVYPELASHGISLLRWHELEAHEQEYARAYFRRSIFPLLTPLSVDPGHPFPFISNLSQSLALAVRQPGRGDKLFARVKISVPVPQWYCVSTGEIPGTWRFVSFRDIVTHHLDQLFPGIEVVGCMPFRVTRSTETDFTDHDAVDLREVVEEGLRRRRFSPAVRLEIPPEADSWILQCLTEELDLETDDVYAVDGELDVSSLNTIACLDLPQLKYRPWLPLVPSGISPESDIFSTIRSQDLLVHHPYESFSATVARFVREAADDPRVRAIKMTAYRIGDEDPLIPLLIRAADNGKQVVCVIELQAHLDEERNIRWAETMEKAGVHVVLGLLGLKTHAKTLLVVRDEPDGIRSYAHIGTGNYHATTARLYTDLGLFTCSPEYTEELAHFFNYLSGRSLKADYQTLLVAPISMRQRFLGLIEREIEHQRSGRPAQIIAKINSLADEQLCEALYRASQAGVCVDLIVRGLCCLRPGVPGLSENIRVVSVVGRLLEHSRIFYFRNGTPTPLDGDFYIGSADWLKRNLDSRVEIVAPVRPRTLREKCWEVLDVIRHDEQQAWEMQSDGSYQRRHGDETSLGTHDYLMEKTKRSSRVTAMRKQQRDKEKKIR